MIFEIILFMQQIPASVGYTLQNYQIPNVLKQLINIYQKKKIPPKNESLSN